MTHEDFKKAGFTQKGRTWVRGEQVCHEADGHLYEKIDGRMRLVDLKAKPAKKKEKPSENAEKPAE